MSEDTRERPAGDETASEAPAVTSPDAGTPPAAPAGSTGAAIEIIVDAEGRVIFTDLPPELQAIVDELDPDSPRSHVCLIPPERETE